MIVGIYDATAGMINQQTMLEVITNNLANVSTCGYKRDELSFTGVLDALSTLYELNTATDVQVDTQTPASVSAEFATDFSQGSLQRTDNPLDLALDGDGLFVVECPDGMRYTRSGNFFLNNSGQLVTADGFSVMGTDGVIQIQGDQVEFDGMGKVIVDGAPVAQLRLADFQDKGVLLKAGNNTFVVSDTAAAEIPASAQVRQGFLEMSNVDAIHEMAKMIETMRVYESYQKTLQLINETLEKANNELGDISV